MSKIDLSKYELFSVEDKIMAVSNSREVLGAKIRLAWAEAKAEINSEHVCPAVALAKSTKFSFGLPALWEQHITDLNAFSDICFEAYQLFEAYNTMPINIEFSLKARILLLRFHRVLSALSHFSLKQFHTEAVAVAKLYLKDLSVINDGSK